MAADQDLGPETFADLPLIEPVHLALADLGHTEPTPIQAALIPHLAAGRDVVGQAQTGTGKTAAFALPILSLLDPELQNPQGLVLTPTRELALQVADAFKQYAAHMQGFRVQAIYGGTGYHEQFRGLHRGAHVVVGTPGRVMDHLRKGSLILDDLAVLVLDEADEMLRMGFIEDVEWILEQTPPERQLALFSATMPAPVRRIARAHLRDPQEVTIAARTSTVAATRQRYVLVDPLDKVEALGRVLEAEPTDGVIVFVRMRAQTVEVAAELRARGFRAAELSGDLDQVQRERTVGRLRKGKLDVLVATDVAARGLDIDRLSHVINFDIPLDPEAYVHRVGRTGRAGREGEAILLVTPDQRRLLRIVEQTTGQRIARMALPDVDALNAARRERFAARITDVRERAGDLGLFAEIIHGYCAEHGVPELEVAAALASLLQGEEPLLLEPLPDASWPAGEPARGGGPRHDRNQRPRHRGGPPEQGSERFRVAVGASHGVKPANLLGAIAGETGLPGKLIGRIDIQAGHSLVDLPAGMPDHVLRKLQQVRVLGVPLAMRREGAAPEDDAADGMTRRQKGPRPRPGAGPADRPRRRPAGAPGRPRKPHGKRRDRS